MKWKKHTANYMSWDMPTAQKYGKGGLYGIIIGKVFFGESMFSKVSNASRYAFINYVLQLQKEGIELIDCQVYTEYLESMGARMIDRTVFTDLLKTLIPA
jgi:leucyl/phenylalanyl-tRNA---protein transferase